MAMFALQVQPGCEAEAASLLNQRAEDVCASVPCSEFQFMSNSGLVDEVHPMVPGLVLLEAADVATVRKACRRARGLADLRNLESQVEELSADASELLLALCGQSNVAAFSEGSVATGSLKVKHGALAGRERLVGRVSNRRKCAYVPLNVGNATVELQLGLRITRKECK